MARWATISEIAGLLPLAFEVRVEVLIVVAATAVQGKSRKGIGSDYCFHLSDNPKTSVLDRQQSSCQTSFRFRKTPKEF